jgi:hypothetical protein
MALMREDSESEVPRQLSAALVTDEHGMSAVRRRLGGSGTGGIEQVNFQNVRKKRCGDTSRVSY